MAEAKPTDIRNGQNDWHEVKRVPSQFTPGRLTASALNYARELYSKASARALTTIIIAKLFLTTPA